MSVIKELQTTQTETEKKHFQPDIVGSVQKLLDFKGQEDALMLKDLGLDDELKIASDMQERKINLEKNKEMYNGQVYHVDAIKELAMNYRLRMLKTEHFKGTVDSEIPAKIREFAKMSGTELTGHHLSSKFYILAPANMFSMKTITIERIPKIRNVDPLLFFKIDDEHYRLIHKWGNDFSPARAIAGWKWKSEFNHFLFGALLSAPIAFVLAALILPVSMQFGWAHWMIGAMVTLIGTAIHHHTNVVNDRFVDENLTTNNWNNNRILV